MYEIGMIKNSRAASRSGSRLDLSFATANFPEDYLPYTSTYSRNKAPYLVWDNGFNGDSVSEGIHYHPTAASIDSHSPASLNQYHLQSHNHLYPTCSASSASWPSSSRGKCCGFSWGCCAVGLTALLIIAALATVVGVSVYLAMITNLHKSSLVTVSGRMRVERGDDFHINLLNTSSGEFMTKETKYETIIKSALETNEISKAVVKSEVYAFRKGSLLVFFRIYLDRRKIEMIIDMSSNEISKDKGDDVEEVAVSRLMEKELKTGVSQLRFNGKEQIIIDVKSIYVTHEFDALIDHDVTDIRTSGIVSNKENTNNINDSKLKPSINVNPKSVSTPKSPPLTITPTTRRSTASTFTRRPSYSPTVPSSSASSPSTSTTSRTTFTIASKATISSTTASKPISSTITSITPLSNHTSTISKSNKIANLFPFTSASSVTPAPLSPMSTSTTTKSTVTKSAHIVPFTRKQLTPAPVTASPIASTNIRITTRSRIRQNIQSSTTATPLSTSSTHPTFKAFSTRTSINKPPNTQSQPPPNNFLNKRIDPKQEGPKFSSVDYGQWRPVLPSPMPSPKPAPKLSLRPVLKPRPLQLPPQPIPVSSDHIPPNHLNPFLKQTPNVNLGSNKHEGNRPPYRIPSPLGIGMHEIPRLMDSGRLNFNFNSSYFADVASREEKDNISSNPLEVISMTSNSDTIALTSTSPIMSNAGTTTVKSPTMVDGFLVPVSGASDPQSGASPFGISMINNTESFFTSPVRGIRKNKTFGALQENPSTMSPPKVDNSHSSVHSSPGEVQLLPLDAPHSLNTQLSSSSRPSVSELSVGSPVLRLSPPKSNKTSDKVNDTKRASFIDVPLKDMKIDSPVLALKPSSNSDQLTVNSPQLTLINTNNTNETKTKSPFDYDFTVGAALFINSSSSGTPSPETIRTTITSTISTTKSMRDIVDDHEHEQPFFPDIKRLNRSITTPSTKVDQTVAAFLRIGKVDKEFLQTVTRPTATYEPVFGERLPKYIPPSLFPKLPSNEINNSDSGINVPPNDNDDGPPEALYDDEIAFPNLTSVVSVISSISSSVANQRRTTINSLETTTAVFNYCSDSEFRCGSGECIPLKSFCNRRIECSDGSDEFNCSCANYLRAERQHRKICDGVVDCWDNTDENQCSWCKGKSFVCSVSNTCIDSHQICDGENNCPNGDDESECAALVRNNQRPKLIGRFFNTEGVLYIRQKGQWAPLCLDNLGTPNDLDSDDKTGVRETLKWKLEDLGETICSTHSFENVKSIGIITSQQYNTFYKFDSSNRMVTSSSLSMVFKETECSTKKTAYIKCDGFECGIRPLSTSIRKRIIGGNSVTMGAWPWQVALYREGEFQCGGVVINDQWLLTAAHCFYTTKNAYWTARFGILRRGSTLPSPFEQLRRITHVIIHEDYVDKGFINDIALLRLNEPINYSTHVRPICLPNANDDVSKWHGQLCTTVGWGKLFEIGRIFPDTLQEVKLPVISTEECRKRTLFLPLYKITDNMFCAGYDRGGRDACLGDSGGPMMCQKRDGRWLLLGVTSNGDGCGRAGRPGVYTKVLKYMNWVNNTINGVLQPEVTRNCTGVRCPLGRCISKENVCNGVMDCRDASDEKNCNLS